LKEKERISRELSLLSYICSRTNFAGLGKTSLTLVRNKLVPKQFEINSPEPSNKSYYDMKGYTSFKDSKSSANGLSIQKKDIGETNIFIIYEIATTTTKNWCQSLNMPLTM
jgi:hypothetical protein